MVLSNSEKLILIMLSELHKKLEVKGDINPDFVQSAIYSGNLWGLEWEYSGLFENRTETPAVVREVCDFLEMWGCLELSCSKLSNTEEAEIAKDAEPFGTDVKFPGFDGNHEGEHMSVARFLTENLGRFSSFKDRADLNAHTHTLDTHRRMYEVFEKLRPSLSTGIMNTAQITELLQARRHPSHRAAATGTC